MRVLRGCKMISLDTFEGNRLLLGLLFLMGYVPLVWTKDYYSLDATLTSIKLRVGDRFISSPNHYFELGIFNYKDADSYFLCIRYAPPIVQEVTWIVERNIPLTATAVLQFENGKLKLSDPPNKFKPPGEIWSTDTDNRDDIVSAELLDTGKLVLKNQNGTEVWNSFDDSPPTDTLLPGQHMRRSKHHSLTSWQRSGDPAIAHDTYTLGWNSKKVLTLSWTCPNCNLSDWEGGSYIPAPDVYAAHTIKNVDDVYFHEELGHLYIGSKPPTAILSGGPDHVNITTLKRIRMDVDGGLRIWQCTINRTVPLDQTSNQTANLTWKAMANWVVSDRPDSRSQCTTIGTCGQFSVCFSPIDSLEPVECRCAGSDNNLTKGWFTPVDRTNAAKGCTPQTGQTECPKQNGNNTGTSNPGMLELYGVDMPWGGDYEVLENLPKNASGICAAACLNDCYCAGVTYSEAEHKCWKKSGSLYNLGYPTQALHGTDRTSFLRNETVPPYPKPSATKDNKLVKILVPSVGIPGLLLIALVIFSLWHNEEARRWVSARRSCCRRTTQEPTHPEFSVDET